MPRVFDLIVPLIVLSLGLTSVGAGVSQTRPDRGDGAQRGQRGQPDSQQPPSSSEDEFTEEDCRKLPGGNAPIRRMARIDGRMSVRNLELTYFGQPLHRLTDADFDYLTRLLPFCDGTDQEIATAIMTRVRDLVTEAKETRQASLDWIKASVAKLDSMPSTTEAIELSHNLWAEMLNREQEMMPSDLRYFANYLTNRRQELYRADADSGNVTVNPFVPAEPMPGG